ncbi:MAG: hypothetical protein FVQ81_02690 [Candidatus Glassbacteria bacterium]|nr:hypothetical protein [Candidatus Glassbacteria bacterium]
MRTIEGLLRRAGSAGLGLESTALIGFSQGACMALELAATHPARSGLTREYSRLSWLRGPRPLYSLARGSRGNSRGSAEDERRSGHAPLRRPGTRG